MSELTRDQVLALAHPLDDATVAKIIATGVTPAEFRQACDFYVKDKKAHKHADVPTGRVGNVISLLERAGATVQDSVLGQAGSTLT